MNDIFLCLNYSEICCSLTDLYSFPDEQCYETNFLSLLLHLLNTYSQTPLLHTLITLLITLIEPSGYPLHRLVKPSMELIYPTLLQLCGQMIDGQNDDNTNDDIIHLLLSVIMKYHSILEVGDAMNMDIVRILLYITSLPDLNMASLTMDVWLFIVVSFNSHIMIHRRNLISIELSYLEINLSIVCYLIFFETNWFHMKLKVYLFLLSSLNTFKKRISSG